MTEEECSQVFDFLSGMLRSDDIGLAWVVESVEAEIRIGKIQDKEIVNKRRSTGQANSEAFEMIDVTSTSISYSEKFVQQRLDFNDRERLEILSRAINQAILQSGDIEVTLLKNFNGSILFLPDNTNEKSFSVNIDNVSIREPARKELMTLLQELDREIANA